MTRPEGVAVRFNNSLQHWNFKPSQFPYPSKDGRAGRCACANTSTWETFSETNMVVPNNKILEPVSIMRILFLKFVPEEQT